MDINIDGAISKYKEDDPRGIHVGHSIYFADEYRQFYDKYKSKSKSKSKETIVNEDNMSYNIDSELWVNASFESYSNSTEVTGELRSGYGYNVLTGEGGTKNNPFYRKSSSMSEYFPCGVKMTLDASQYDNSTTIYGDSYIHYESTYTVGTIRKRGIHLIFNGMVDASLVENLDGLSDLTTHWFMDTYPVMGVPVGVPGAWGSPDEEIRRYRPRINRNNGLVFHIEDDGGMQDNAQMFTVIVTLGTSELDESQQGISLMSKVIYKKSSPYIYIPFNSMTGLNGKPFTPTADYTYIESIVITFGEGREYDPDYDDPPKAEYIHYNRMSFHNFKFSIYAGTPPQIQRNPFCSSFDDDCVNTWDNLHLIPTSRPVINSPELKTSSVDIPGSDGKIDLSRALSGFPIYENRIGSLEFIVDPDYDDWVNVYQKASNYFNGAFRLMALEDDPYWIYSGIFKVNSWTSDIHYSTIVIDYSVKPYKRYLLSTDPDEILYSDDDKTFFNTIPGINKLYKYKDITIAGSKAVTLKTKEISTMPIVPTIIVYEGGKVYVEVATDLQEIPIGYTHGSNYAGYKINRFAIDATQSTQRYYNIETIIQGDSQITITNSHPTSPVKVDVYFRPGLL